MQEWIIMFFVGWLAASIHNAQKDFSISLFFLCV